MVKRFDRVYALTIGLLLAVYVGIFFHFFSATAIHVPQFDMLGWLLRYIDHWHPGQLWAYLWMPYDEHRLVWSLLLVVADVQWFGGTAVPFFVFDSVCWAAAITALLWAVWRSDGDLELGMTRAAAGVLLLGGTAVVITCSFPIYGCMAQTAGFTVVAVVLYRFAETNRTRTAAVVLAVLAAFGTAAGLATPFLLIWLARRRRDSLRWVSWTGLVAVALTVVYIPWTRLHSDAASLTAASPLRAADFLVRFFGLPWSRAPWLTWPGHVIGFTMLTMSVGAVVVSLVKRETRSALQDVALALILFALCTGAMLCLGRMWRNPEGFIPERYVLFAAIGHAGVAFIAIDALWPTWQRLHSTSRFAIVTLVTMVFLVQQVVVGHSMIGLATPFKTRYRAFVTGVWTPDMVGYIYPDRTEAYRALTFMKSHHLYQGSP